MKKRFREINIFSMSVVDLFACAMGAFILLVLILFPYYLKSDPTPCLPCEEPICEVCEEPACEVCPICSEIPECPEPRACPVCPPVGVAKKQFLLVIMSWNRRSDIDLHVIDPLGNRYYYEDERHPPSPAYFAKDNTTGPGNEIWLHPSVTPGTYKVYYDFYSQDSRTINVKGKIITQEDKYIIPDCRLRREGQRLRVATIDVDDEGNVRVDMRRC